MSSLQSEETTSKLSPISRFLLYFGLSFIGAGFVPVAPGTAGSIAALPFCIYSIQYSLNIRIIFTIALTIFACLISGYQQKMEQSKDPQFIVIDEVAGMFWSTLSISAFSFSTLSYLEWGTAFIFFRIFDALKPWPVKLIDKLSKDSSSPWVRGAAIVLDDVAAGILTLVLVFCAQRFGIFLAIAA